MLNNQQIESLKESGYSFEEIEIISQRMASIQEGTAQFLSEEEFLDSMGGKKSLLQYLKIKILFNH